MVLNVEIEAAEMGRCLGFGGFEHAVALSCSEDVGAIRITSPMAGLDEDDGVAAADSVAAAAKALRSR